MPIDFDYSRLDIDLGELDDLEEYVSAGDVDTDAVFAEEEGAEPDLRRNLERVVVVDGLPKGVPQEKHEKLSTVIRKNFSGKLLGDLEEEDGLTMPADANGATLGYAFLVYQRVEGALQALKLDGLQLDAKHKLKVFPFPDLEVFENWPEEYTEPAPPEYEPGPNVGSWLTHPSLRDQYLLRHGTNTEIYWCENPQMYAQGTLVYDGARERRNGKIWCEMYTAWSPQGSYLTTFHRPGIVLWGGDDFQRIRRIAHADVQHVLFSPDERFVFTWNGADDGRDARALILWEVRTGREVKSFVVNRTETGEPATWPVMRWSPDSRFFARQIKNGLSVFEAGTGRLLDRKAIKAKGIREFQWSNLDATIAYWSPEQDSSFPARVVLLDPETRTERRAKNLVNVREVKLHWQNDGDFLCAQVLRHTKTGKTTFTNFEIFRMRDAGVPNEMVEMRDMVEHFSWEPSRERFAVIHGESVHRLSISFYSCGAVVGGQKVEKLYTVADKAFNVIHWSPAGNALLMMGTAISGEMEFWDVDERVCTAQEDHFMCNEVLWDPSGRMVATVVTQPMFGSVAMKYQMENGYSLWGMQGASLRKEKIDRFFQFAWRPRPKTTLTEKEQAKIERSLKTYMARFEKDDDVRRRRLDAAANKEKMDALSQFRTLCDERRRLAAEQQAERRRLGLVPEEHESDFEIVEETEEVMVSEKVDIA